MCFKSDKHTLETRNQLLKTQREQAEINATKEIISLTLATNVSYFFYFKKLISFYIYSNINKLILLSNIC